MRKILLSILTALLILALFLFMKNGISIGRFKILGFQGIADANSQLTTNINTANTKEQEYTSTIKKLQSDVQSLAKAKKEYLDLVTVSTDSEIQNALQTKNYTIEYLWSRVGNHATKEGVVVKMEVVSSSIGSAEYNNLNFTATGTYLALTNFIYDLENDSNLDFTIDSFQMTSKKCTFTVKNVKIIKEKTTSSSSNTSTNKLISSGVQTNKDNSTNAESINRTNTSDENAQNKEE